MGLKNQVIKSILLARVVIFWCLSQINTDRFWMIVFYFFGFSRRGLILYWGRGSVKNSNLNGLFMASYWFRASLLKATYFNSLLSNHQATESWCLRQNIEVKY